MSEVRNPAVAGMFYPADPGELRKMLKWCFTHRLGPGREPPKKPGTTRNIVAMQVPHAGYMYSGPCAAVAYLRLFEDGKPDCFIILGPNHTGVGLPVAVWPAGKWKTPLGEVAIDEDVAKILLEHEDVLAPDYSAHVSEHSIEVQLPFLQYLFGSDFTFVPICMGDQSPETARRVAEAIVDAIKRSGKDIVVLASSDMTHYEPHDRAVERDNEALAAIAALDVERLYDLVESGLSMCGFGPVAVAMHVAREFGAGGRVLRYYTSGDITGDYDAVVGYAAVSFEKGVPVERPRPRRRIAIGPPA